MSDQQCGKTENMVAGDGSMGRVLDPTPVLPMGRLLLSTVAPKAMIAPLRIGQAFAAHRGHRGHHEVCRAGVAMVPALPHSFSCM